MVRLGDPAWWRRNVMLQGRLMGAIALAAAVVWASAAPAQVFDLRKYPDWTGQWDRADPGPPRYDPSKRPGRAQGAPLTPEYQANFEANLADQEAGGQGNDTTYRCIPLGMPRQMTGVSPMEFIIAPTAVYVLYESAMAGPRRIFTDGRDWPGEENTTFTGYSIGHWLDTTGSGRYDVLEIETRGLRGPRVFDPSGLPFHADNQSIFKERIYLDKANPDLMHDATTTLDHALTRPWSATKTYKRTHEAIWVENNCTENNNHVAAGKQDYMVSADGFLMPVRKGQPAPDLRYFAPQR
jgi:hypothetical protein